MNLGGVSDSDMDKDDKLEITNETEDTEKPEIEEPAEEKPSEAGLTEVSDSEMDQAKIVDDQVLPSSDTLLEESSTCENEDLKSILDRHVVVDLPLPEGIIPLGKSELSTILEESAALGESKEQTPIPEEEEEEEEELEVEAEAEVEAEEQSDAETELLEGDVEPVSTIPEPVSEGYLPFYLNQKSN